MKTWDKIEGELDSDKEVNMGLMVATTFDAECSSKSDDDNEVSPKQTYEHFAKTINELLRRCL